MIYLYQDLGIRKNESNVKNDELYKIVQWKEYIFHSMKDEMFYFHLAIAS